MDETRSAQPPHSNPPRMTRDTAAISTGLAPGECREYPEVPGYEILEILGHGGMGVVYRARQIKANRLVALKMIRMVEHASDQERMRFQIETEAVARLQHPNIVQLYEVGEVRGLPFFSLELCDGGTLTQMWKKQRPSSMEAAKLIETLSRAMHYAHLRGVVHRDLKPGNVLVASPGRESGGSAIPKITDFGLAKRIDTEARDVSQSGAVMGTAAYMAPEQAAGKVRDTGPAADVYALGVLLYEALTGRPPFEGPQHVVLVSVLADEPPPPSRFATRVPRDLETITLKCLQKDPTRRYADAENLADDLRRYQEGKPISARPISVTERVWKWARRRPTAAALVLVSVVAMLVLLVGGLWFNARLVEQRNQARREADNATKAREYLVNIFKKAETDTKGGNVTVRELLAEAETDIPHKFADQPELREELEKAVGEVKRGIARRTPQAMILEVRGNVTLRTNKGDEKQAVAQALLNLDDSLILSSNAEVQLVFLSDLHKERIKGSREVTIDFKGCDPANAVKERDNSVLMTFVRLPKGTFYMGWDGRPGSAKMTEIEQDFEIAVHEVTQGQWQAIMGSNPSWFSRKGGGRNRVLDISDEELKLFPVESVSWDDVQTFLKKLNEKERERGYFYRLPTEAEWEYACRGGAVTEAECSHHFYFDKPSNDLSSKQANFNGKFPNGKGAKGTYLQRPTRVGAYPPNKQKLCDMLGNVGEWTSSKIGSDWIYRGGMWGADANNCRASSRMSGDSSIQSYALGFRLTRTPYQTK